MHTEQYSYEYFSTLVTEDVMHRCPDLQNSSSIPSLSTKKRASTRAFLSETVVAILILIQSNSLAPLVAWNFRSKLPSVELLVYYSASGEHAAKYWFGKYGSTNLSLVRVEPLLEPYFSILGDQNAAGRGVYSRMLTDARFWEAQTTRPFVLTLQEDTWICGGDAEAKLAYFLPWADYVGAPWPYSNNPTAAQDRNDTLLPRDAALRKRHPIEEGISTRIKLWTSRGHANDNFWTANGWARAPSVEKGFANLAAIKSASAARATPTRAAAMSLVRDAVLRGCRGIGNGGLSLRRVATMVATSKAFGPVTSPEDIFFCALSHLFPGGAFAGVSYQHQQQQQEDSIKSGGVMTSQQISRREVSRREASRFSFEELLIIERNDGASSWRLLGGFPFGQHKSWSRLPHATRRCIPNSGFGALGIDSRRGDSCPGLALLAFASSQESIGICHGYFQQQQQQHQRRRRRRRHEEGQDEQRQVQTQQQDVTHGASGTSASATETCGLLILEFARTFMSREDEQRQGLRRDVKAEELKNYLEWRIATINTTSDIDNRTIILGKSPCRDIQGATDQPAQQQWASPSNCSCEENEGNFGGFRLGYEEAAKCWYESGRRGGGGSSR